MGRRLPRFSCIGALCAVIIAGQASAQQAPPAPPCPPAQLTAFEFLVGHWRGVVYDLKGADSTSGATAVVSAAKVLSGCALEEHWHFEDKGVTEVDGIVLRGFDVPSGKWSYNLVTSRNEHVTYDGQQDNGTWRFYYDLAVNGQTVRLRITWVPTPTGYSEQIARSSDAGKTWALTRHINFVRAPGPQ
jgi:hypothetical protein